MHIVEVLAAACRNLGAKTAIRVDPRVPLPVPGGALPMVTITFMSMRSFHGLPGNPLAINTVPGQGSFPYDAELVWWREDEYTFQVDVFAEPLPPQNPHSAHAIAAGLEAWLLGVGRDTLRAAHARTISVTRLAWGLELPGEMESTAVDHVMLEVTLGVTSQVSQRVETVESVVVSGREPEQGYTRTFTVPS